MIHECRGVVRLNFVSMFYKKLLTQLFVNLMHF